MVFTRFFFENYQQLMSEYDNWDDRENARKNRNSIEESYNNVGVNIDSVIRPAKIISQIIAYLWLNPETTIDFLENQNRRVERPITWFQNPTIIDPTLEPQKPYLYNLLIVGNPREVNNTDDQDPKYKYNKFLSLVFAHQLQSDDPDVQKFYRFPIYQGPTLLNLNFETDNTVYQGYFKDPNPNIPDQFTIGIAFPPRPELGPATLERKQLSNWQKNVNTTKITPPNPFIPLCSC